MPRTSIFNIHTHDWDDELLALFNVPRGILPTIHDNVSDFGVSADGVLASNLPICGMAGDQQAAVLGQACFDGHDKINLWHWVFLLANTGAQAVASQNRLLTTVAYRLDGQTIYGWRQYFMAGAIVQWLRDALCLIEKAGETLRWRSGGPGQQCCVGAAFTGLVHPLETRGTRGLFNMTRDSGKAEIVRAALSGVFADG